MEEIFYAVLALHIAGKPINKENIGTVLSNADTPVDWPVLDAAATFVESLETVRREKETVVDHRNTKTASPAPEAGKASSNEIPPSVEGKGRYVYGIATGNSEVALGPIGIDGNEVYTIPYRDIMAIVHHCSSEPYQSLNQETIKSWVRTHQSVLDLAREQFGSVIPLGFDTILPPNDESISPDQVVRDWLKEDYKRLRTVMGRVEGKDEYAVQVSYERRVIIEQISTQSEEIKRLKQEMADKSPGMVYMYKQRLEKAVRPEIDRLAHVWFNDFYSRVKRHTDDIIVEKTKKLNKDRVMLLNLSCLVPQGKVDSLGKELEEINNIDGFSVHFSGPWPPYSFVAKPVVPIEGE